MAQLSELKRGKIMKIVTLSLVLLIFTAMTVTVVNAFTYDWINDATISELRDTDDTPGLGPGVDPWYADNSLPSTPSYELLWLYVGADPDWVYVRWDVREEASAFGVTDMYNIYVLRIDAVAPFFDDKNQPILEATHLLILEIQDTDFFVQIVNASDKTDVLWTGGVNDNQTNAITPTGDPNVNVQTALEARFDRSILPEETFYVMSAETHFIASDLGSINSAHDYIEVEPTKVPWFTDLALTLLVTTILAVVIKKKKIGLPVKIGSGA